MGSIKSVHGRCNLVLGPLASKDLGVYFQGLHAFGWAAEWTWLRLCSSSTTCPMWPCPPRNRIFRSSDPVTLTDSPGTGSRLNSNWHAVTWEQTNLNPVSGRNSAAFTCGKWHKKKYLLVHSGQGTYEKSESSWYPWFLPAFWPSTITRERQGETNRKMTYSLWAEAWARTAEVKYTLRDAASTLRLESPKERQCRGMIAQDGVGGACPQLCSQRQTEQIRCFLWVWKKIIYFP